MSGNDNKGFSGFGNFLSDINPEEVLKNVPTDPILEPNPEASDNNENPQENTKFFGSKAKWFFGFIAVIIIGVIVDENKNSSHPAYNSRNTYESPRYITQQPDITSTQIQRDQEILDPLQDTDSSSAALNVTTPVPAIEIDSVPEIAAIDRDQPIPDPAVNKNASFDCSNAKSTLEILICSDISLSSLDGQIGDLYSQAREAVRDNQVLKGLLLDEQREFLRNRTEVCKIPYKETLTEDETQTVIDCLIGQYNERVNALKSQLAVDSTPAATNEVSPEIKASIYAATLKFFHIYKESGLIGVKSYVDSCYTNAPSYENILVYCMTFDSVASGIMSAIEKDNNYPLTPEFEYSVHQARVKKRLSAAGIVDPYEQENIISGLENEAQKAVIKIIDEQQGADQ